jgi:GT2 family glycosyltransferase
MDEHVRQLAGLYEEACRRHGQRAGRVGVVVLDRGRPQDAARAARSARDPALAPRIVVVENGAGPESRLPPGVDRLILAENRGFAAGMNEGLRHLRRAGCDRFLLLNNDAVLEPGALRRLAEALADTGLGAVAPVVLRESDGRVESRGARFHTRSGRYRLLGHGEEHEAIEARESVEALAGTALMLSAAALDRVGGLEEAYFHSFEDADWCLRARKAGFGLAVVRGATARHAGSRTLGEDSPERLYYAARNHLRAAERALPLRGPGRFLRQATILALNLGHAFLQGEVPRGAGILAVLMGAADFVRGRFGPKPIAP